MPPETRVIVRTAVRHDVCLRGAVSVVQESGQGVRLSAAAGATDGWIEVDVVDISAGGIGLISTVFFPRRTLLTLRVFSPQAEGVEIFAANARIQRVCMTDRRPAYMLGTSFERLTAAQQAHLRAVLTTVGADAPAKSGGA